MKNKIILLMTFILVLSLVVVFFPNESNISEPIPEQSLAIKEFPGKEIFLNKMNLMSNKRNYYFSFELDKELKNKETYELNKDVYLDLGLLLDSKNIKIKAVGRKKIFIYNNSSAFTLNNSTVSFENVDFYITNTLFFIQSSGSGNQVEFKNCNFFLYGKSVVEISSEKLKIEKSIFKKMDNFYFPSSYLLSSGANEVFIKESLFLDLKSATDSLALLTQVNKLNLESNFFVSSLTNVSGLITLSNTQIDSLVNNYFEDVSLSYKVLGLGQRQQAEEDEEDLAGEELDGGIAIWTDQPLKPQFMENNTFNIQYIYLNVQNESFAESGQDRVMSQLSDELKVDCKNVQVNNMFMLGKSTFFSCE